MSIRHKRMMGRQGAWAGVLAAAWALSGCQTPPPEAKPPAHQLTQIERQQQLLRGQGFAPGDDGWDLQMSGKLLFDFDSAEISAEGKTKVIGLARSLKSVGIEHVRVEGHTDNSGSAAYNQRLSLRRAEAVADLLAEGGIDRANIEVKGLGQDAPVTLDNDAQNRRVAIIVPMD